MLIRKKSDIRSSDITPERLYWSRREFLVTAGLASVGLAAGVPLKADSLSIAKRMVTTNDKPTPLDAVTSFNNFYEFGSEKDDPVRNARPFKSKPWSVTIAGLCGKPGTYTFEDIVKPHPLEERVYRMRCVEGWSMVIPWVGFPLGDLLKRFEPASTAKFVQFTSVERPSEMSGQRQRFPQILPWPYTEGLRMDQALHPLTILAIGLYGQELPNQNGAPSALWCRGSMDSRGSNRL